MIALKNKPNVIAPTSTYPHGKLKDDTGVGDGTPVNQQTNNDIHSFFQQLMVDAGLTPNNILDNEYDGFQLNTALGLWINKLITSASPTKQVVLPIGDWNMDANPNPAVAVALPFSYSRARATSVLIRNDSNNLFLDLIQGNPIGGGPHADSQGAFYYPSNVITHADEIGLVRLTGGDFDSASYSATGYNRGWVTIDYIL